MDKVKKEVPEEILKNRNRWNQQVSLFRTIHILLVLATIIVASMVAAQQIAPEFAWIAAVASGILASFNIENKVNNMRKAWRTLNAAILHYEKEEDFTVKMLINAYEEGEKIVGDVSAGLDHRSNRN